MRYITDIIHKIIYEAIEEAGLVKVVLGKVVSLNPLEVQLEQKIFLGSSQLILPNGFIPLSTDRYAMLRIQNDDRYLVIGRI